MRKILFLITLFMPLVLMADTWDFPMGGNTQNEKISVTDNAMSIRWDDIDGNHIDFTFDKGESFYANETGDWTYDFFSKKHGSNGNILFMYADMGDDRGVLLILDVKDKSNNNFGKELMKVGVNSTVFNKCFKLALSKGIFKDINNMYDMYDF